MVLQLIVSVRNKHGEVDPAPQFMQIVGRFAGGLPDHLRNARVVPPFITLPVQSTARRHVGNARFATPIETPHESDGPLTVTKLLSCFGRARTTHLSKLLDRHFCSLNGIGVMRCGELRDPQVAVASTLALGRAPPRDPATPARSRTSCDAPSGSLSNRCARARKCASSTKRRMGGPGPQSGSMSSPQEPQGALPRAVI